MAVSVDKAVERFEDIEANVAVVCNWTLYVAVDVHVYYGAARVEAVQNVDYLVALNSGAEYSSFTITPKTALLTKIDALIALDASEENYIEVRRETPLTNDTSSSSARSSVVVSRAFDKATTRMQELAERVYRAFVLPFAVADEYDTTLPEYDAGHALVWHPTIKKLVNSSADLLTDPTTQAIDAAAAAAASELAAENSETAAEAAAASAAVDAATAAGLIALTLPAGGTAGQVVTKTGPADGAANWQTPQGVATGTLGSFLRTTAPTGWIVTGGTIGNASSGATTRADADTEALFAELWLLDILDTPIYTSAGAPSTRGADAAADFAADKRIFVPDARGIFERGLDASRGVDPGRRVGSEQTEMVGPHPHNLAMNPVADHQHTVTASGTSRHGLNGNNYGTNWYGSSGNTNQGGTGSRVSSAAGGHTPTGTAQNNTGTENRPRNLAVLKCIKL